MMVHFYGKIVTPIREASPFICKPASTRAFLSISPKFLEFDG
jgi:hypothetical protein